ncbi:MAG: hypothetical protein ACK4ND_16315 [Cytophagaceae bacterium]
MENQDNLSFENEFRKLKLSAEKGAFFSDGHLPPELEKQFLDNIELFHQMHEKRELITIYEFINKPPYKQDLDEKEISQALEKLMQCLHENGIHLSTLCEVPAAELYRFIIEDFFPYQIDNVKLPGFKRFFTYEEFYPNDEYDIKRNCEELMESILRGYDDFINSVLVSDSFKAISGKHVSREQLSYIFKCFKGGYKNLELVKLEFLNTEIWGDKARQDIEVSWRGDRDDGTIEKYSGNGYFTMAKKYDFWSVSGMKIPGLEI